MPNRNKYKISPEQRKSGGITNGINASNKAQLKKISKIKHNHNIPQVPLSDLYMRVDKIWHHKGKSCRLCGVLINDPIVIDKHRYICEVLNKSIEDDKPRRVQVGNRVYYTFRKY
jgi:formamidopyrimidine-DNA glycosylase